MTKDQFKVNQKMYLLASRPQIPFRPLSNLTRNRIRVTSLSGRVLKILPLYRMSKIDFPLGFSHLPDVYTVFRLCVTLWFKSGQFSQERPISPKMASKQSSILAETIRNQLTSEGARTQILKKCH